MGATKTYGAVIQNCTGRYDDRSSYYYARVGYESGGPSIVINLEDIEDCKEAVSLLYKLIFNDHSPAVANELFSQQILSKRQLAADKNYQLLITVMHRMKSQSIEKVAAEIAKENESRPLALRHGPSGTTNPSVMAKQIRRLIKATRRR
jgi:hypothetical protein